MLHIINVSESCFPEVCSQRREDGASHGRLVDIRRLGYQELYELGKFLGHGWSWWIFIFAIITLIIEVLAFNFKL